MTLLDLKTVRRCGTCGHLVPTSHNACPYCSGHTFAPKPTAAAIKAKAPGKPSTPSKPMSPQTKRNLLIGLAAVAVFIAALIGFNLYQSAHRLDKSIFEPLSDSEIQSICSDDPSFYAVYQQCTIIRDALKANADREKFSKISYKQIQQYLNHSANNVWLKEQSTLAKNGYETDIHSKVKTEEDALVAKWKKFVEDNTIDNYIKVEVHTTYYQDGWYTHPGFYFTTKVLRNDLAGVSARLTPVTSEGYQYNNFEADLSLSDLTYNTSESKIKYWTHLDYSGFWNYYNPQLRIYSITTKDGRTITEDSANGVPEEVTLYINNECEDTEYAMIKALIKSDYPSRADYTAEFINKKLKEIDPLCFEMFSKLENAGIGLSPQFEANEADEDCAVDTVATEDYSYDYNFGY